MVSSTGMRISGESCEVEGGRGHEDRWVWMCRPTERDFRRNHHPGDVNGNATDVPDVIIHSRRDATDSGRDEHAAAAAEHMQQSEIEHGAIRTFVARSAAWLEGGRDEEGRGEFNQLCIQLLPVWLLRSRESHPDLRSDWACLNSKFINNVEKRKC